jgi:hypothetical protein
MYFGSKAQWIKRKEKQAFFNTPIIILQEGALDFFLCSFINLLNVSMSQISIVL